MSVDASALVAITRNEPERAALPERFTGCSRGFWSPITCWEAISALGRSCDTPIVQATMEVKNTAAILCLKLVEIDEEVLDAALDAYTTYGKRSGHPARLNMGDCFACACA